MDEALEAKVDRMIEAKEIQEKEQKVEARKESILAKRKLFNIKATDKTIPEEGEQAPPKPASKITPADIAQNTIEAKQRVQ